MKINHRNSLSLVRHLQALNEMLLDSPGPYPFTVYESLIRLEKKAHRLMNTGLERELTESENKTIARIEKKVKALFKPEISKQIFINGDARGYALKIKGKKQESVPDEFPGLHYDWGKYGILAPQF